MKQPISLENDFIDFLKLCNLYEVRYLIIGGYAVSIHGYPRSTKDLDVLIQMSEENAGKMKNVIDAKDIEEALNAANAIGDDRLQKQTTGQVMPDAFTHGTSAQRMYWFKKGFETGDIKQGNTFTDPGL